LFWGEILISAAWGKQPLRQRRVAMTHLHVARHIDFCYL